VRSIEQAVLETYHENMRYFQEKHPDLYSRLTTFDVAIAEGLYVEKFSLEYRENSYFDILNLQTNEFLYHKNSNTYSHDLFKTIDLKRTGAVFEAQQRFEIKEEELEEIGEFKNFHSSLWASAKILHYNAKVAPKLSSEMKELYKFIFLGTGLGLHIEKVISTYGIQVVFIQENNLEIFRLSLFITNYAQSLKKCKAYFSVMQDYSSMQLTFTNFLNESFNYNLYIKFLPFSYDHKEEIHKLQSITLSQDYIAYPYQGYMARSFATINQIINQNLFFNISTTYNNTLLTTKPILVLASGPSLQNNTSWIQKHQEKFLIVTVLSACKHLFYYDIIPDIVVHIDPQEEASLRLIKDIDISKFDNSTMIFSSSIHQKVAEQFNKDKVIFIEQASTYKVNFGFFGVPTVGEYAVILPMLLGATKIYIIGLDLALDPKTMQDHIDLHISSQILKHNEEEESIKFQDSVCYVKGNFQDIVPSKPNFRFSISQFNKAVEFYKQTHQNIYNLSNGAYLDHTIPLKIDAIPIQKLKFLDKCDIQINLHTFFINNGSSEVREVDKINILHQLTIASNIVKKCNSMRQIKVKELKNYLYTKLIPFVYEIAEMDSNIKSDMGTIFYEYFKITLSFIFDTFNTKNLKDTKKHVQIMDTIVLDEVEKIASVYYNTIKHMVEDQHPL
jgi:hypothetical protein